VNVPALAVLLLLLHQQEAFAVAGENHITLPDARCRVGFTATSDQPWLNVETGDTTTPNTVKLTLKPGIRSTANAYVTDQRFRAYACTGASKSSSYHAAGESHDQ
jgi:hypothetical protein